MFVFLVEDCGRAGLSAFPLATVTAFCDGLHQSLFDRREGVSSHRLLIRSLLLKIPLFPIGIRALFPFEFPFKAWVDRLTFVFFLVIPAFEHVGFFWGFPPLD